MDGTEGMGGGWGGGGSGDPVIEWARGGVHRFDKVHPNCQCGIATVEAGGEAWEVPLPRPTACAMCWVAQAKRLAEVAAAVAGRELTASDEIKAWLAARGDPRIKVERVPDSVDLRSFVRVYSHLKKLMAECPQAMPRDGIRLTYEDRGPKCYGEWIETEHRLNLPARYYGSGDGLARLEKELAAAEARGSSPSGCRAPEYVIDHEYGHCLRHRLNGPRYGAWWVQAEKSPLGSRGAVNYSEGFAEAYAIMKELPRDQWPTTVQVLHDMLEEDGVL